MAAHVIDTSSTVLDDLTHADDGRCMAMVSTVPTIPEVEVVRHTGTQRTTAPSFVGVPAHQLTDVIHIFHVADRSISDPEIGANPIYLARIHST